MPQSKSKKHAKKKADKYFSEYIRKRDSNDNGYCRCATCNRRQKWNEIHAGHFISRRHEGTRYDERNVYAQCAYCNTYKQGEQYKFGQFVEKRHGKSVVDELWRNAMWTTKRTKYDYEVIAETYRNKIKEIDEPIKF